MAKYPAYHSWGRRIDIKMIGAGEWAGALIYARGKDTWYLTCGLVGLMVLAADESITEKEVAVPNRIIHQCKRKLRWLEQTQLNTYLY